MTSTSGPRAALLRIFVTGLIAALPLAATVAIFWWAIGLLLRWLGPNSRIGGVLAQAGLGVTGSEIAGYLLGVGVLVVLVFGLGLVVEAGLQRGVSTAAKALIQRIPLVGTVYDLLHRMVQLLSQRDEDGLKSMSPVWCRFGGDAGQPHTKVLALLATRQPVLIDGAPYYGVIVPTAPVPVGGGLLYLPVDWVTPAEGVGLEALTSIYVSMGVTTGQFLKTR